MAHGRLRSAYFVLAIALAVAGASALAQEENAALEASRRLHRMFLDHAIASRPLLEGKNIVIEWRNGDGKPDRLRELAGELVPLKVDVNAPPLS